MKRRQIRDALGSEREALLSQLTEQMVSLHHSINTRVTLTPPPGGTYPTDRKGGHTAPYDARILTGEHM